MSYLAELITFVIKHLPGQHLQTRHGGKASQATKVAKLKAKLQTFIHSFDIPVRRKEALQMSIDNGDWESVAVHLERIDIESAGEKGGEFGKPIIEHGQSYPINVKMTPNDVLRAQAESLISEIGQIMYS